jgi:hypothetical protein
MSIYYIIVNKTKKEYFDLGDMGDYGVREHNYRFFGSTLLGYLMMTEWENNDDKQFPIDWDEDNKEFFFQGHWAGDKGVMLVSEFRDEYDIAQGLQDGKEKWINISIPLRDEWNASVKDCFDGEGEKI